MLIPFLNLLPMQIFFLEFKSLIGMGIISFFNISPFLDYYDSTTNRKTTDSLILNRFAPVPLPPCQLFLAHRRIASIHRIASRFLLLLQGYNDLI
jgi:hypothetical protein